MNRTLLAAAVPVCERQGRHYLIVVDTIPAPWRERFTRDLRGSACPVDG